MICVQSGNSLKAEQVEWFFTIVFLFFLEVVGGGMAAMVNNTSDFRLQYRAVM